MHQEVFFRKPRRHAVVEHHALFVQHEAVAAAPDAQLPPAVDVDAVQERRGVRPPDVDLAERRRVEHSHRVADGEALPVDRFVQRLPKLGVVPRPLPLADVFELRPCPHVPLVDGRLAHGVEELPEVAAGHGPERDRRVWLPEGRRPDIRDRFP